MSDLTATADFFKKIEEARWTEVEALLTEDFHYYGPLPEPIDRPTWLDCMESLRIAFPDWSFHIIDIGKVKGRICAKVHMTGTHTEELDLSPLGLRSIPASGTKFEFPDEEALVVFKGGLIAELHVSPELHDDLLTLLSHLEIT